MNFSVGQTFYLDPNSVNGANSIFLTEIAVFFQIIPSSNNNAAGNPAPGVTLYVCQCTGNNVPDVSSIVADSYSRVEYVGINTSSDANTPTIFSFVAPLPITTGKYYAFVLAYDSPEFILWTNVKGDLLVGTNEISSGPSTKYAGDFFLFGINGQNLAKPVPQTGTDLKFIVDCAQFTANSGSITLVNDDYEFLVVNAISNTFIGGEQVYQDFGGYANGSLSNVTFLAIGTINVASNSFVIQGTNTAFTNSITGFNSDDFIVITDGTLGNVDVLQVDAVTNDTYLTTLTTPSFSNALAFYKKTSVGTVYKINYANGTFIVANSTSNSAGFWTANSIKSLSIISGGSGYNNTDYILVSGGSLNAVANLSTNSSGGIITINITNTGIGFTNTGVLSILAANGSASNGTTGNVTVVSLGASIRGEISQSVANLVSIYDFAVGEFSAEVLVKAPSLTTSNTYGDFSNTGHVVDANRQFSFQLDRAVQSPFDAFILSKSTEVNTPNSQLANIDGIYKSAYIGIDISVNQPTGGFVSPYIYNEKLDLLTFQFQVNNSDAGETTDQGNCISKHITTPLTFANNALSTIVEAYLSAYVPAGTTVEVFARIENPADSDPYTSKAWSPLLCVGGNGQISSSVNSNDVIQFTYILPPSPASKYTLSGTVTVANNSTTLATSTNLSANVANGNLIKVYNPTPGLSNANFFVASVISVNSTAIVINQATTNNSVLGAGFAVDVLTYPTVAYADPQNQGHATYFNNQMVPFVGFNVMAFKVLLMSNSTYIIPRVTNLRGAGVTA